MPPLPKPPEQRRRRNHGPQITYLDPDGRKGQRTPKWPLEEVRAGEAKLWIEVWKQPEAVLWERERSHRLVARYVRVLAATEQPDASTKLIQVFLAEARQLEDRLLLSPKAKVMARYAVRVPEEPVPIAAVPAPAAVSPRDRLKAAAS